MINFCLIKFHLCKYFHIFSENAMKIVLTAFSKRSNITPSQKIVDWESSHCELYKRVMLVEDHNRSNDEAHP